MGRQKTYTEKEKQDALALRAIGTSYREIERKTGVPASTARGWMENPQMSEELAQIRAEKKREFADRAWKIIGDALSLAGMRVQFALEQEEAFEQVAEQINGSDLTDKDRRELISKLRSLELYNIRDLSVLIGTLYDKQALTQGESTCNQEINVDLGQAEDWAK